MAPKATPPGYLDRLRALAGTRLGRLLAVSLGGAALFLVVGGVVRQARAYAHGLPAYRLRASSIRFLDLPRRLGPLVASVLRDPRAFAGLDVSVFDPHAEDVVRDVVASHPMVESVKSVAIRYPHHADVRVALRSPAAWFRGRWVDGRRGWLLLSADQHRLDPSFYRYVFRRLPVPLPKVVGVEEYAPECAGQFWGDLQERVAEGLAAADVARRLYADLGGRIFIDRIDVSRFPARPELRHQGEVRLILDDGREVEWGRTARDPVAGEDGYEVKLRRLEQELHRTQRLSGARIDVRYELPRERR